MRAEIDYALSLANCASCRAAETTCTAYPLTRITFAGTLTSSFPQQRYSLGPPVKNTGVAPCVPLAEYAKSIQFRNPSILLSLEGTMWAEGNRLKCEHTREAN